ncbi:hypothetical protein [Eubacterium sp. 1001713B170207_170306_E7]|uniref:hypothetical protein n=1 Tax=Eubacterium sp. 1001713B170207_170306_E7 TaxID=2787097 RepID=UPI00189C2A2C|nr:hypothetical protein [Eubacterium sp. 1001713B170207_170306_E7]
MSNTFKKTMDSKQTTEQRIEELERLLNSTGGRTALEDRCYQIIHTHMAPVLLLDTPEGLLYGVRDVERLLGLSMPRHRVRRLLGAGAVSLRAVLQPDNLKCYQLRAFINKDSVRKLIAAATYLTEDQQGAYRGWLLRIAPMLIKNAREAA